MNDEFPPHSADRMPTLTEVLELEAPSGAEEPADEPPREPLDEPSDGGTWLVSAEPLPALAIAAPLDTQALVGEVLSEVQPRIDMLFESRLREALAPALARAAEVLIREARGELGNALRELVEDAVKRALQRRGGRW